MDANTEGREPNTVEHRPLEDINAELSEVSMQMDELQRRSWALEAEHRAALESEGYVPRVI